MLSTPSNPVSIGVSLQRLSSPLDADAAAVAAQSPADSGPSYLGSMLFNRYGESLCM